MTCFIVDGAFTIAVLLGVIAAVFARRAQANRLSDAPPARIWLGGWDLYRPQFFTPLGNSYRETAVKTSWGAAAFLLLSLVTLFLMRGAETGICWFRS